MTAVIEKLKRLIERPGTPGEGLAARPALKRIMARLPVVGRVIERDRPCKWCPSTLFTVEPGKAQHAFHLRCAACSRGGVWMTRSEAEQIEAEHAAAIKRGLQ
jgi:hypothetical protein